MRPVYKAPPMVAPPSTWTGCYVGANLGGGWADKHWSLTAGGADLGSDTPSGVVGGGQLGCNYQTGAWVFGIEGMFDGTDMKASHLDPFGIATLGTDMHWFATLTGRIGYAFDRNLFYVKGGGAWVNERFTELSAGALSDTGDMTRSGWTVGGGWEYAFAPSWSVKVEYDYMDFGTLTSPNACSPGGCGPLAETINQHVNVGLVGVNYRFLP